MSCLTANYVHKYWVRLTRVFMNVFIMSNILLQRCTLAFMASLTVRHLTLRLLSLADAKRAPQKRDRSPLMGSMCPMRVR